MTADSYCRDIEAYLCRKNDGHLVRVVGPSFEVVSAWEAKGIPVKIACRGIDRYFERYYAKGPRRRPVRVEFCDADVLDAYDEWRRAVGIGTAGNGGAEAAPGDEPAAEASRPHHSLRAHLDRVATRLTALVAEPGLPPALEAAIERLIATLAEDRTASRVLRGEAREQYVARLRVLDGELMAAAAEATPGETLEEVRREAAGELASFKTRMPEDAYRRALDAAGRTLLRERLKLPVVSYD